MLSWAPLGPVSYSSSLVLLIPTLQHHSGLAACVEPGSRGVWQMAARFRRGRATLPPERRHWTAASREALG